MDAKNIDWSDRDAVLAAVKEQGDLLRYAAPALRADREIVLAAVEQDGLALRYAAACLRADREVALAAVKQKGEALEFVGADEREYPLVQEQAGVFRFGIDFGRSWWWQLPQAKDCPEDSLRNDREIVLAAVRSRGVALAYASAALRDDREVVLEALRHNGAYLCYVSERLRNDREVVLCAVRNTGILDMGALMYVPEALRADREIVLAALRSSPNQMKWVAPELKEDPEVIRTVEEEKRKFDFLYTLKPSAGDEGEGS